MLYVVCIGWDYQGEALDSVWTSEEYAVQRCGFLIQTGFFGHTLIVHTVMANVPCDAVPGREVYRKNQTKSR